MTGRRGSLMALSTVRPTAPWLYRLARDLDDAEALLRTMRERGDAAGTTKAWRRVNRLRRTKAKAEREASLSRRQAR